MRRPLDDVRSTADYRRTVAARVPYVGVAFFVWVGIFSVLGSAGWALAMTLENAALVRAVGQIELVFTFIASHLVLKERPSAGEWLGSVLVIGGVVLILIGR